MKMNRYKMENMLYTLMLLIEINIIGKCNFNIDFATVNYFLLSVIYQFT